MPLRRQKQRLGIGLKKYPAFCLPAAGKNRAHAHEYATAFARPHQAHTCPYVQALNAQDIFSPKPSHAHVHARDQDDQSQDCARKGEKLPA